MRIFSVLLLSSVTFMFSTASELRGSDVFLGTYLQGENDERELFFLYRSCSKSLNQCRREVGDDAVPFDAWLDAADASPSPIQNELLNVITLGQKVDMNSFVERALDTARSGNAIRKFRTKAKNVQSTLQDRSIVDRIDSAKGLVATAQSVFGSSYDEISDFALAALDLSDTILNQETRVRRRLDEDNGLGSILGELVLAIVLVVVLTALAVLIVCIPLLPLCIIYLIWRNNRPDRVERCRADNLQCEFDRLLLDNIPNLLKLSGEMEEAAP